MRQLLQSNIEKLDNPLPWKHITEQIGMYGPRPRPPIQSLMDLHDTML